MTRRGQVTLPKAVRDALGLMPGSEVEFIIESERVVLRRRSPTAALQRWQGYLRDKLPAPSVNETMELLRGRRAPSDGALD